MDFGHLLLVSVSKMSRLTCHYDPGYQHGIHEGAHKHMTRFAVEISRTQRRNGKDRKERGAHRLDGFWGDFSSPFFCFSRAFTFLRY
jgi:hypothetical protein